jgi:outer membrane protein TolC
MQYPNQYTLWTLRSAALVILILPLTSCGLSPQYVRPELDIPGSYAHSEKDALREYSAENRAWWKGFDSKALPNLQAAAVANNHAFQAERHVLAQAFAQARAARASLFPTIEASGYGSHKGSAIPPPADIKNTTRSAASCRQGMKSISGARTTKPQPPGTTRL